MNYIRLSSTLSVLKAALKSFPATRDTEYLPQIVAYYLHQAVKDLVGEVITQSLLPIPLSTSLQERVQLLADGNEMPGDISDALQRVVQSRNMLVHAGYTQTMSFELLSSMRDQIVTAYQWYLTDYKRGPLLQPNEAIEMLSITAPLNHRVKIVPRKVFISYAREDFDQVSVLYERLVSRGHKPWMDKKDLLPGQEWESEIRNAIKSSDYFIACLSSASATKRGFFQKEMRIALDVLEEIPSGEIFLIPLRLEPCTVPSPMSFLHWLDLNAEEDYETLYKSIEGK